ncbi:MAG: AAA family ATPase [Deltaproteobacteria bacterium]|nr:AAA family ATPase [Deltaproteobacteria bacterium]
MIRGNFDIPYLEYLGLHSNPFPVTPDADDFFVSPTIDSVITELVHGIITRKGFFVLTGEVGVGKTTISRKILQTLNAERIKTSLVFNSLLSKQGLIRRINKDFGISGPEAADLDIELERLNDFVLRENELGHNCAIIIDDAQNLSCESLETVRLISNLESNSAKLVQILLIGQPELLTKLNSPGLRQLKSRIVIQCDVTPLSRQGLREYIDFKLTAAGSGSFRPSAAGLNAIFKITGGNLRQVNILMDRCLYIAYYNQSRDLSKKMVYLAAHDLKLQLSGHPKRAWLFAAVLFTVLAGLFVVHGNWPVSVPPTAARPKQDVGQRIRHKSAPTIIPKAVTTFLQSYGLQRYSQRFWDGILTDKIGQVGQKIYRDTGRQLIQLPDIPRQIYKKIDFLRVAGVHGDKQTFICFWKPALICNNFYWGATGPKIQRLQQLLRKQGYYNGPKDGIVGRGVMQAVIGFQTANHLPITGRPDKTTIFLLDNSSAKSLNIQPKEGL